MSERGRDMKFDPAEFEKNHPPLQDVPDESTGVFEISPDLLKAAKSGKIEHNDPADEEAAPETIRPMAKMQEKVAMVARDVGSDFTSAIVGGKDMSAGELISLVTKTLKTPEFAKEKFSSVEVLLDLKNELNDTAKWLRAAGKESEAKKHEEMAQQIAAAADAAGDKRPIEVDVDEIY